MGRWFVVGAAVGRGRFALARRVGGCGCEVGAGKFGCGCCDLCCGGGGGGRGFSLLGYGMIR